MGSARATHSAANGSMLAELSRRFVQLFRESTGRGPTRCRSYWASDDIVLVMLGEVYTPAERTLVKEGREDSVIAQRAVLQEVLEARMRSTVEELTGRRVKAFMSAVHSDPELNAELFVLEPSGAPAPSV
jgi:uncharacterized protein YbcI